MSKYLEKTWGCGSYTKKLNKQTNTVGLCVLAVVLRGLSDFYFFLFFFLNKVLQFCVVINDNYNILSVATLYTHIYISISLYLCLCVCVCVCE